MLKIAVLALVACFSSNNIIRVDASYNEQKNLTTVRLRSTKLSGPKVHYQRLCFSVEYSYPGQSQTPPDSVNFILTTVVKARRLNPDLYVVFVVDGKPIHFSSNRSAIRNPVRGRPWIGEKMVFTMSREEFRKMAAAEKLEIKMGDVTFEFSEQLHDHLLFFAQEMKR